MHNTEILPELQQIISAWPNLPEHIKAAIMALAKQADMNNRGGDNE